MGQQSYRTSISLDYEMVEKLRVLAKMEERSVANYLKRVLTSHIEEQYELISHSVSISETHSIDNDSESKEVVASKPIDTVQAVKHDAVNEIEAMENNIISSSDLWSNVMPKTKF